MKKPVKNVVVYYDPAVLKGTKVEAEVDGEEATERGPEHTIETLKELSEGVRAKSNGMSVLLRDATKFAELENRVAGVLLVGHSESSRFDKIREAYEAAEVEVHHFDGEIADRFGFEVSVDPDHNRELGELRARALELGVNFDRSTTANELRKGIEAELEAEGDGLPDPDEEDDNIAEAGLVPVGEPVPGNEDDDVDFFDAETADFDALKAYADENEIDYASNIGEDTLRGRVREHVAGANEE